ncbi:MAG: hypothetical protein H7Y60_06535 [Rhodospirillaceae bacterium]|nr:hypothetical protein [Rhodospirillales bacterium]
MKKTTYPIVAALVSTLVLSGCATNGIGTTAGSGPSTCKVAVGVVGTVGGAALGAGLLGKGNGKILTGLIGAGLGFVASQFADGLICEDRQKVSGATEQAVLTSTNQQVAWSSPTASGSVTPVGEFRSGENGNVCRDLQRAYASREGKNGTESYTYCVPASGWSDPA